MVALSLLMFLMLAPVYRGWTASAKVQQVLDQHTDLTVGASRGADSILDIGLIDVAVLNVTPYKTIVGTGQILNMSVTVVNQGTDPATFNLTAHVAFLFADTEQIVNLVPNQETVLDFTWNTTGVPKNSYVTWAYAQPIAGENDTINNLSIGAVVTVSMVGDLTGFTGFPDGRVDIRDLSLIAKSFGQNVPPAQSNCDINSDEIVNIRDIAMAAKNFGKSDP